MKKITILLFFSSVCFSSFGQWVNGGTKITTTQNVGIGTESPSSKLDVVGTISANSFYLRPLTAVNGWRNTQIDYDGHDFTISSKVGINAHNQLVLKPGGAGKELLYSAMSMYSTTSDSKYIQKIRISTEGKSFINAGNVGIGTENPQNKLDVAGTIRATEVKVEALPWADFVFDTDYKLPALSEVENHINEHKHLPNIPSEADVKENGVSLGEMQAKLLQKIEELTLYVIQQDKTIKKLEDKIQKLEAK